MGHMYTYGWFMLVFDRKQHKFVKQLKINKFYLFMKLNTFSIKN